MNRLWVLLFCGLASGVTPKTFVLDDPLDHPFLWWPQTLLSYQVQFDQRPDLDHLVLTRDGHPVPLQFSDIVRQGSTIKSATLHFLSDLPSGGHREFVLGPGESPVFHGVTESAEGKFIVLDSGVLKVRIPASQTISGTAPGPVQQMSRDGRWFGSSTLVLKGERIVRIDSTRVDAGPLFISYLLTYTTQSGGKYIATVRCIQGMDFVQLRENMDGLAESAEGVWTMDWRGLPLNFRQAANHPYPFPSKIEPGHKYEDYPWEPLAKAETNTQTGVVSGLTGNGELPFTLGIYEPWAAYRISTFANFWNSSDAVGVFIDDSKAWQDHEYSIWRESPKLQVSFHFKDGALSWAWPIARGSRSTCLTLYDHAKDVEDMRRLESYGNFPWHDGQTYNVPVAAMSHVLFLQNRYGTINLDQVKDWVLTDPGRSTSFFQHGQRTSANDLASRVLNSQLVNQSALTGTRQNGDFGPTVSRRVEEFWIDGFERLRSQMTGQQRKRLTAVYLYIAYIHAGEEYMPMIPMFSGHPNFLADVKSVPACMAFLFPSHPQAKAWADEFEKFIELNTHYHTRPRVDGWDAKAGRWTENLGTYVWAFLRPVLHADMLLQRTDQSNRLATPEMAALGDWLVNALSAPFNGETAELLQAERLGGNHEWGLVHPEDPRRVHPPIGAHAERRMPPRALWYLGTRLQRLDPLTAEHLMWAARPTDQDMELSRDSVDPFAPAYDMPDNRGTDPHLVSGKYTGYGITLRAAVGSRDEVSLHLQQIDEGPNYRWGLAGEGGTGVVYYFAGGKSYSFNGTEDVGDRAAQDTDFCTNFGVWKDGVFHSVGRSDLTRPMYDLGVAQFAEVLARPGYSTPEYVSRSVLLAGHDYFVLYDDVYNEQVKHRLSWFVRNGKEFPNIGIVRPKQVQRTELQTGSTKGRWYDGVGDSMVVVSHRNDVVAESIAFGARVRGDGIDDLVFRDPAGIHYAGQGVRFDGTAGIVRKNEIAIFHGTRIAAGGVTMETTDLDLGISATLSADSLSGAYYATHPSSVRITGKDGTFFVDGERQSMQTLPKGLHHWEITTHQPAPMSPRILRTENSSGGAKVFLTPVASAATYRFSISQDGGQTWRDTGESTKPEIALTRLKNETKVHVRAVALNPDRQSLPGPEYPIYITSSPSLPPEGLHLRLNQGSTEVTWGEVLGVAEYRLYARTGSGQFRIIYRGLQRKFTDRSPAAEYQVKAVNGNGEGPGSRIAVSDPSSWRNFDPRPGEPFRRTVAGQVYYPN
jgi:hypothetical protein